MKTATAFTVVASCRWLVHWGGVQGKSGGGTYGQLTKLLFNGHIVYVRENIKRGMHEMSSGERLSLKTNGTFKNQHLEVCCLPSIYDSVAAAVHDSDTLNRPVIFNSKFTVKWAEQHLAKEQS